MAGSTLRLGLVQGARSLTLKPHGNFTATELATGRSFVLKPRRPYLVEPLRATGVQLGPHALHGRVRLIPGRDSDLLELGGAQYRGVVTLIPAQDGSLTVVDELGVEEYLQGVLAKEMNPEWPLEALKAQAVVARTYAWLVRGRFEDSGFDLSAGQDSQVYAGVDGENPRILRAVRETSGLILTFEGKPLAAHYHSCCAGRTRAPREVWNPGERRNSSRPLLGVACGWCRGSPQHEWRAYFAADDILTALQANGLLMTRLANVRPGRRHASGYLQTFKVEGPEGTRSVGATDLRKWLGSSELRSAYVTRVLPRRRGYEFVGLGFGHGAGLCQWGARVQAERKHRNFRQILQSYFPNAKLAPATP